MDYDPELVEAIMTVAELPTTQETPGVAIDQDFDLMINMARHIVTRDKLVRS